MNGWEEEEEGTADSYSVRPPLAPCPALFPPCLCRTRTCPVHLSPALCRPACHRNACPFCLAPCQPTLHRTGAGQQLVVGRRCCDNQAEGSCHTVRQVQLAGRAGESEGRRRKWVTRVRAGELARLGRRSDDCCGSHLCQPSCRLLPLPRSDSRPPTGGAPTAYSTDWPAPRL